jgi:uncharacterized membrane protein
VRGRCRGVLGDALRTVVLRAAAGHGHRRGHGRLPGSLADVGIDDDFIRPATRSPPGTSALFLLSTDAVVDRVMDALRSTGMELFAANLSSEQEDKLRTAFEHE